MTQHITGYPNEVYCNKISEKVFEKQIPFIKDLITEMDIVGNFENSNFLTQNDKKNFNLNLIEELLDNFISFDKFDNNYEIAMDFISKYSDK